MGLQIFFTFALKFSMECGFEYLFYVMKNVDFMPLLDFFALKIQIL